jgi:transcriptional regulator with XRE-family HTH domain
MMKRRTKGTSDAIDKYVGSRIRSRRVGLRMSQTKLGEAIGVTFQQIQKYENGTNRIGASNLFKIGRALGVEVASFYQGMPEALLKGRPMRARGLGEGPQEVFTHDPMNSREAIELVHNFYRIKDPFLRKRLALFVRAMARSPGAAGGGV